MVSVNLTVVGLVRSMRSVSSLCLLLPVLVCACGKPVGPNVILIIVDTMRADHLGCYGYDRACTPTIDSLAAEGTLFASCQANAPWTLPSHASIWTGLTPLQHRTGSFNGNLYGLDVSLPTFATVLNENGYVTVGFVNVSFLAHGFGFGTGFDHYSVYADGHGRAGETVDEVLAWFAENIGNQAPKLLVVHLFDVHAPYDPPAPFDTLFSPVGVEGGTNWSSDSFRVLQINLSLDEWSRLVSDEMLAASIMREREQMLDMYDGEIAWVDSQLGRLLAGLREMGVTEGALVMITADHGEEFVEHGFYGHGHSLYQELLHVPLIVSGPGIPRGAVETATVSLIDIMPTILLFAGLEPPQEVEGLNLLGSLPDDRRVFSSSIKTQNEQTQASVLQGNVKGIFNFEENEGVGFNLVSDPLEQVSLPIDSALTLELENYWGTPPISSAPLCEETEATSTLEGLGYI